MIDVIRLLLDLPRIIVLTAFAVVVSCPLAIGLQRLALIWVATGAAILASALYYVAYGYIHFPPPPLIGVAALFGILTCLPIAFLVGLACRAMLKRSLNVWYGGQKQV